MADLWLEDRSTLGAFYQSQGRLESGSVTNDCGPTNLAMVLNLLAGGGDWNRQTVDPFLARLRWPFPPSIRGATPPWSIVKGFNRLAGEQGTHWEARRQSRGNRDSLVANLEQGSPTTIILV